MFARSLTLLLCLAAFAAVAQPQRNSPGRNLETRSDTVVQSQHLRKVIEFPAESAPITSITATRNGGLIAYTIDRFKRRSALGRVTTLFSFDLDKLDRTETTLKVWNPALGQLQTVVKDETVAGFRGLYLTPNGAAVATHDSASTPAVRLWSAESGKLLAILTSPAKRITMSALSPNGSFFAIGYEDGTARLWVVPEGELRATLASLPQKKGSWLKRWANNQLDDPHYRVRLYFSPDSKLLAIAGMDNDTKVGEAATKEIKVWDTATGQLKFVTSGSDAFSWYWEGPSDLFSPDGSIVATTYTERNYGGNLTANSVKLWSSKDGLLLRILDHARAPVKFSPDGKRLVTGLVHWDDDGTWGFVAEIWNVETGKLEMRLSDPKGSLDEIFWSPDGRTLATTGGGKYTLTLWDSESGRQKTQTRLVRNHCYDPLGDCISDQDYVSFSPDSRFVIAANKKSLRLIDARTGTVLEKVEGIGRPAFFLSNGQLVTRSANKKSVMVWEILD
jgi:WD40 repeat protein